MLTKEQAQKFVTEHEDGYNIDIPLNVVFEGVKVTNITMFVSKELDDDGEPQGDGDLGVNWEAGELENTGGGDMGSLIMRGGGDEVGDVMDEFYWGHGFDAQLSAALIAVGFSEEAAVDVSGSEWGMQDEERASYDACKVADEVRAAMQA